MRRRSVGALVTTITGLLAMMLVLVFFVAALAAMEQQRIASNDLESVNEAGRLLAAKQAVRIEAGFVGAALESPAPASPRDRAHLVDLHRASAPLLDAVSLSGAPPLTGSSACRARPARLRARTVPLGWMTGSAVRHRS